METKTPKTPLIKSLSDAARQRKISLARDVSVVPEKPSSHACRSSTTADGNGAFCTVCGETLA